MLWHNSSSINRIDSIKFNFAFATRYQDYDVEDYNPVNVTFFIEIALSNELYGSGMFVEITFPRDPKLQRQCRSFRMRSTIVDIFVMILLTLSSCTYIMSIVKTVRLAKVCIYIHMYLICNGTYICILYIVHTYA